MNDVWTTLVPLAIASAALPLQIAVTVLLAQGRGGRAAAAGWMGGMLVARIAQGLLFGFVVGVGVAHAEGPERPGPIASTLMLVMAVLLLASAIKSWIKEPDEDAPAPAWMSALDTATPLKAALAGGAIILAAPKLWVFTLGAIGAIAEASLGRVGSMAAYIAFTIGALSVHISVVVLAYLAPAQSTLVLGRLADALATHGRTLKIGIGLVFGIWFLTKALAGFGIL